MKVAALFLFAGGLKQKPLQRAVPFPFLVMLLSVPQ
ncbi:MAG: hypothetical protein QOD33_1073 [Pyrinomonadaceae bacterium]|jgi:hypothetical protein|nr:hypothetical protein [Pyrinomonadaceae bacterium]